MLMPTRPSAELTDAGLIGIMRRYGDLCIHAIIDLRRSFSRAELEAAMEATLMDFPVLGHRYAPRFWRDRWVAVTGPISDLVRMDDDAPPFEGHEVRADVEATTHAWIRCSIDATTERQLRIVAIARPDGGMRLILSILHLAVDGAGMAAVGHVFGAHLYGVSPSLPIEPRRDVRHALDGLRWYHLPSLATGMARLALQPIRQLAAARRDREYKGRSKGDVCAAWRHMTIRAAELRRIKAACPSDTSINDVLMAALAQIAARRSSGGPVVVTYTMDLRRYSKEPRLTATNSSSVLSTLVPREAITTLPETARAVAAITSRQMRRLAGPAFMLGPHALGIGLPHAVARRFVGLLAPVLVDLPLDRGLLMTNVGRIDDGLSAFGDDVTAIRIVGPNHEGFPVPLVVAFGYRGELHLDLFACPGLGEPAIDELEREIADVFELDRRDPLSSDTLRSGSAAPE
jgi:NRPS condensation-like uncharacterized protein